MFFPGTLLRSAVLTVGVLMAQAAGGANADDQKPFTSAKATLEARAPLEKAADQRPAPQTQPAPAVATSLELAAGDGPQQQWSWLSCPEQSVDCLP